jgi:drug/metabolite transporter (DMT)-like permease
MHAPFRLSDIPPHLIFFGATIMVVSCAITSYANILMKMDAIQLRDDAHPRFIMARKFVLMAITLYILGGVADVISLGMVPLSLRACASVLTIPFNALFARITLGERMNSTQIIGASITVFSAIIAMLFAAHQEVGIGSLFEGDDVVDKLLSRRMLIFVVWTIPIDIACLSIVFRTMPRAGSHVSTVSYKSVTHRLIVLACTTVSVSYQTGWTNLFIKCIAELISDKEPIVSGTFVSILLIMLLSALAQMHLLSAMMRLFDSVTCIPPYQILITMWLVVLSSVVFHEYPENVYGFSVSLFCSFFGILMVALPGSPPSANLQQEPLVDRAQQTGNSI